MHLLSLMFPLLFSFFPSILLTSSPALPLSIALQGITSTSDTEYLPGSPDLFYRYIGDKRGIQGYRNSCYLDATIFGLFALSDSFDQLILAESTNHHGNKIKELLLNGVINPLRRYTIMHCTCEVEQQRQMPYPS